MEFLDGMTLKHRIAGRPLEIETVLSLGSEIADALDAAHSGGIVHRDIKPAEIVVDDAVMPKFWARGLAKVIDQDVAITPSRNSTTFGPSTLDLDRAQLNPGAMLGTVAYMSPEQVRAKDLDARTDLFRLAPCCTRWQRVQRHFAAKAGVICGEILHSTPLAPSELDAEVPSELERIVKKCLEDLGSYATSMPRRFVPISSG